MIDRESEATGANSEVTAEGDAGMCATTGKTGADFAATKARL
jgi:hypothetical protein